MEYSGRTILNGMQLAANGDVDKTVIAAQGAGKVIRVLTGHVNVTVAATGGGGKVALEDGADGTRIWEASADAVGDHIINFMPIGYPLSDNTILNLTVDGAATTQASARATLIAIL